VLQPHFPPEVASQLACGLSPSQAPFPRRLVTLYLWHVHRHTTAQRGWTAWISKLPPQNFSFIRKFCVHCPLLCPLVERCWVLLYPWHQPLTANAPPAACAAHVVAWWVLIMRGLRKCVSRWRTCGPDPQPPRFPRPNCRQVSAPTPQSRRAPTQPIYTLVLCRGGCHHQVPGLIDIHHHPSSDSLPESPRQILRNHSKHLPYTSSLHVWIRS
jgi:hypothetical protein